MSICVPEAPRGPEKVDKDLSSKWLHKGATPWPSRGHLDRTAPTIDNHVWGREMNRSGQPPWQVLKGCQTKRAGEKDWQMTL